MTADTPETEVTFKSKPHLVASIAACGLVLPWAAGLAWALFWWGSSTSGFNLVVTVGLFVMFTLSLLINTAKAIPGGACRLQVSSSGIKIRTLFIGSTKLEWPSVKGFVTNEHAYTLWKGRWKRVAIRIDPALQMGREIELQCAFKLPAEELCERLIELKRRYETVPNESPCAD